MYYHLSASHLAISILEQIHSNNEQKHEKPLL